MSVGTRSDVGASHDDRYDFDRLEECVEFLIREHERLSREREALRAELVDREHRITSLEAQLDDECSRRKTAVEGVDKILSRLEQLQASVTVDGAVRFAAPDASAEAAGDAGASFSSESA